MPSERSAGRDLGHGRIVQSLSGEDRVGLFTFDRNLDEVAPIGTAPADVLKRLAAIDSYGRTSVFDAIADTANRLSQSSRISRNAA
jgi:hypothetical protein